MNCSTAVSFDALARMLSGHFLNKRYPGKLVRKSKEPACLETQEEFLYPKKRSERVIKLPFSNCMRIAHTVQIHGGAGNQSSVVHRI